MANPSSKIPLSTFIQKFYDVEMLRHCLETCVLVYIEHSPDFAKHSLQDLQYLISLRQVWDACYLVLLTPYLRSLAPLGYLQFAVNGKPGTIV